MEPTKRMKNDWQQSKERTYVLRSEVNSYLFFLLLYIKRYLPQYQQAYHQIDTIIILMSDLLLEDLLANPDRQFVIKCYGNINLYIHIIRNEGSELNKLCVSSKNTSTATRWKLATVGNGRYGLISQAMGGSLQVPGKQNTLRLQCVAGPCLAEANQQWIFQRNYPDDKTYFIKNQRSPQYVLDVDNNIFEEGIPVNIYSTNYQTANTDLNQRFRFFWAT